MFLSPTELPIENINRVFGVHESFINKLTSRYDEDLVPCLLNHITQPCLIGEIIFASFGAQNLTL